MCRNINFMGHRISCTKCLIACLGLTFVIGWYIAFLPIQNEKMELHSSKKRLAVLVPFRNRFEELLEFVPHMYNFLSKQNIPFHIFVVQQIDNYRFNRASLINVGFLHTKDEYDYIVMHDVDLLPLNDKLKYSYPEDGPIHISSPDTHPRYHYATFIGGILLVKREHYLLVNGMSNNYWGWGMEDDEFYVRLKDKGLVVDRPSNISTGTKDTFRHVHDRTYRKRDMRKCYNQLEVTKRRDRLTGLHNVNYKIHNTNRLTIDDLPLTIINVELICNRTATPWCLCPIEPQKAKA